MNMIRGKQVDAAKRPGNDTGKINNVLYYNMLPNINAGIKPYVYHFLQKYRTQLKPYSMEHTRKNRILVRVAPIEGANYKKLHIIMNFDDNDNVRTAIDTDDQSFYTGLFYMEVIRKERDNEAWKIIRSRYNDNIAIEKFIYFLLNAPHHIIDLLE